MKHKNNFNHKPMLVLEVLILCRKTDERSTICVPAYSSNITYTRFEDAKTLLDVYINIVKVFVG